MHDFETINKRIELVGSLASCEHDDAWILAEIGDVLATGYAAALQADARCLSLTQQVERLLLDGEHPERAGELARERSTVANAARCLRDRLALLRELFAQVSGRAGRA